MQIQQLRSSTIFVKAKMGKKGGGSMNTIVIVAAMLLVLGGFFYLLWPTLRAYRKYRGMMVVTCPETNLPVGVTVDIKHAAASGILGLEQLQLSSCAHWPDRPGCDQACLRQIEVAPEDCLIRTKLTKWYKGKSCAVCGTAFEEIHWHDHRPALMDQEGKTIEWRDVEAEDLPRVLETDQPVCWNCHIMQSFVREHGDLVILRDWHPMEAYPEE
jgi:hypothetical protein